VIKEEKSIIDNNDIDLEDLAKLVYDRMNDFVNDEYACAIFNRLSKARSCLYN